MREIEIKSHPAITLKISVSDEMIRDYKDCEEQAKTSACGKDCDTCSWQEIKIEGQDYGACTFDDLRMLLEE